MNDEHPPQALDVRARLRALADDGERGAQAVEYAMLGAAGAAACATLIALLRNPDFLKRILQLILEVVAPFIGGWFS